MRPPRATTSIVFAALSATSLLAQTWSPRPGFATQIGLGVQSGFGSLRDGRYQFLDGNFPNQVLVLRQVAIRAFRGNPGGNAEGRSWSRVTLDAGPARVDRVSGLYSKNYLAPPTRCFAGPVTWPTQLAPPNDPRNTFPIKLPFNSVYVHAGNGDDFVLDFQMIGGTLASQTPWPGRRWYLTEGYSLAPMRTGEIQTLHDPARPGCIDSAALPSSPAARASLLLIRYGPTFSNPALRGQMQIVNGALGLGPSAPFINVVDFAWDPLGVRFGAGCENLHLKASPAALYFTGRTDFRGFAPDNGLGLPGGLVPYRPALQSVQPASQFAWADTRTGALKLSSASAARVPLFLVNNAAEARRISVSGAAELSGGIVTQQAESNPVFRYN